MSFDRGISQVTKYWAANQSISAERLFAEPVNVVSHGPDLADYNGLYGVFRGAGGTISFPAQRLADLRPLLPGPPTTAETFAKRFRELGYTVVGPAFIGYADAVPSPQHPARLLTRDDLVAVESLREACTETDWDHGGSQIGELPTCGVFDGATLVALAGFKVWGEVIAHICIVTHPEHRGRGFGRSAVARLAEVALERSLIPQYRTLESNLPSIRVAESLGFVKYATSVAVRLS